MQNSFNSFSTEIEKDFVTSSMINPESFIEELKVDYIFHILLSIGIIEFIVILFGLPCVLWFIREKNLHLINSTSLNRQKPD